MRLTSLLAFIILSANVTTILAAQTNAIVVRNEFLVITFNPETTSFTLTTSTGNHPFVTRGTLSQDNGLGSVISINDPLWGQGQAVEITYPSGSMDRITLYPDLPFALCQTTQTNPGTNPIFVDKTRPVSLSLDLGRLPSDLRSVGTAGLTKVNAESNPGSYAFLAIANPDTRSGIVTGWLTYDRGSGVVFSDVKEGHACINAQIDYGRLQILPNEREAMETFMIGHFDDTRLGLEAFADAIAHQYKIKLKPQPTVYCTWYHAGSSDEKAIIENATFAKEHLVPFGFSVVQIDDHWQAGIKGDGPRRNFTQAQPDGHFPSGMKKTADNLKALGLVPGLWFMPFAGTSDDPFFADKQQMFATQGGKPYVVRWGGTCFDMTHPDTRVYVRSVAHRIAHDWGYQYFKMDGLWTGMATGMCYVNAGYQDDQLGSTVLHDPNKTHVEAYRDGLKLVRETAGDDVFFLGCNTAQNMRVLGASFGLVDAMRIGPDNGRDWSKLCRGPRSGSNLYFLHNRIWYNDPDPIYVRDSMPLSFARILCSWVTLTGQLNASSINYASLSPERLDLLKRTMPAHGLQARPVDFLEQHIPRIWLLTDKKTSRHVIGLFNWQENENATIKYSMEKIGLSAAAAYIGFDYWADTFVGPFAGQVNTTLPGAGCRIIAVRPMKDYPQVISTSRHITQGMIDILDESWQEQTQTLSGTCKVVGNDPYELRIAVGHDNAVKKVASVTLSEQDMTASVRIELKSQEDWKVRVLIQSPTSREVHWSVRFE